jgi:HD-like signal output (HDOD) protein
VATTLDPQLLITRIKNLPPLPEGSMRIINAVNDPDIGIDELVAVISLSPSLVARLLGLANSSYFGRTTPIIDLRVAIIQVLGFNLVKSLALSIAMNVEFDFTQCPDFNAVHFWRFGLTRALLAQKLASRNQDESLAASIVYTSALLMDIGVQAAVYVLPEQINGFFAECQLKGVCINQKMLDKYGISFYQLGYLLLVRWQLPEIYALALKYLSQPTDQEDRPVLVSLLRLSQQITQDLFTEEIAFEQYQQELDFFGWTGDSFESVIREMEERKDEIQELATIING